MTPLWHSAEEGIERNNAINFYRMNIKHSGYFLLSKIRNIPMTNLDFLQYRQQRFAMRSVLFYQIFNFKSESIFFSY